MPYVQLKLRDSLPEPVRFVIREGVEPLLRDVHRMLAMPAEPNPPSHGGQMQQSIALVLLATVAGVSKTLLHVPPGEPASDRARFTQCLTGFFPWDLDPPTGASAKEASEILYRVFRNPLVHSLGMGKSGGPRIRIGRGHPGERGDRRVEELERTPDKPVSEPCLVVSPVGITLWLEPFYWGVRKVVERWAYDLHEVSEADARLTKRVADR